MYNWSIRYSNLPREIQEMICKFSTYNDKKDRECHELKYEPVMEELKYKHFASIRKVYRCSRLFYRTWSDYKYFDYDVNSYIYKSNLDGRYYHINHVNNHPEFPTQMKLISK